MPRLLRRVTQEEGVPLVMDVIGFIAGSAVLWLINHLLHFATQYLPIFLLVTGAAGAIIAILIGYNRRIRIASLILSQRRSTYFVLVVFAVISNGIGIDVLLTSGLKDFTELGQPTYFPLIVYFSMSIIATISMIIVTVLSWQLDLNKQYIKVTLDHMGADGDRQRYYFINEDTNSDVRRQARILDCIARMDRLGLTMPSAGVEREIAVHRRALSYILIDKQSQDAIEDYRTAQQQWIDEIWQQGRKWHYWREMPEELEQPLAREWDVPEHAESFFGNQLDRLFNRGQGFRVFHNRKPRLITIVIKGPPGAGKSTLALQTSVTLAKQGQICIYYTLEEEERGLLISAQDYNWAMPDREETAYKGVLDYDNAKHYQALLSLKTNEGAVIVTSLGRRAMTLEERRQALHKFWVRQNRRNSVAPRALCVVIDSFEAFANIGIGKDGNVEIPRSELLELKEFFRYRCNYLILLVEDNNSQVTRYIEFVADVVLQLGRQITEGYTTLYVEVTKARNQYHALGQSQMKIRSKQDIEQTRGAVGEKFKGLQPGVIVYPSLHYRLFQAQQRTSYSHYRLSFGLPGLDEMITGHRDRGGVRRQSVVALIGANGTGKSLVAMNFLIEGVRENTRSLLLSFRSTEETIKSRGFHQDAYRMRMRWIKVDPTPSATTADEDENLKNPAQENWYHAFTWDVAGIVHWKEQREHIRAEQKREPSLPLRLPYFFATPGPLAFAEGKHADKLLVDHEAEAMTDFLYTLADAYSKAGGLSRNEFERIRNEFEVKLEQDHLSDNVVQVEDSDSGTPALRPKRIELARGSEGKDARIEWDSRYHEWDITSHQTQVRYDTGLLVIKEQRPGYVTPEEFFDQILRVIKEDGADDAESTFERVVFDDISQLSLRFPLLAKSDLFLPTLIDLFKANGITSLFLADQPEDVKEDLSKGITTIADQVIHFAQAKTYSPPILTVEIEARPDSVSPPQRLYVSPHGDPRYITEVVPIEADARPANGTGEITTQTNK